MDFRFLSILKDIKIFQPSPLPSESGHSRAYIKFIHEPHCSVQSADELIPSIDIKYKDDKTIAIIPPQHIYDETHWLVSNPNGIRIKITVLVGRVWWIVGEENKVPSEWGDKFVNLSRDNFLATSNNILWMQFPEKRWVDKVLIGFKQENARLFPVKVTENKVAISLRDFGDAQEL